MARHILRVAPRPEVHRARIVHIHGRFVHVELPATRRIYGLSAFLPRAELTFDGRDQRIKVSRLHEIRRVGLRRVSKQNRYSVPEDLSELRFLSETHCLLPTGKPTRAGK